MGLVGLGVGKGFVWQMDSGLLLVGSCIEGSMLLLEEFPSSRVISFFMVGVDEAVFKVVKGTTSFWVLWTM